METETKIISNLEKHFQYLSSIESGNYPDDIFVPLDNPFENSNGVIQNLILGNTGGSAIIHSVKDSVRANHYHSKDWHYAFLVSGEIEYYHRKHGDNNSPKSVIIRPGQMFFTPPMVEHAMVFPQESVFVTFSKLVRTHENHENDVVRVNLVGAK